MHMCVNMLHVGTYIYVCMTMCHFVVRPSKPFQEQSLPQRNYTSNSICFAAEMSAHTKRIPLNSPAEGNKRLANTKKCKEKH